MQPMLSVHFVEMQEGRQASVSVQKGKSLMFSIALIVELVIIC